MNWKSRKLWVAIGTIVGDLLVAFNVDPTLVTELVTSITVIGAALIAGIAHEDNGRHQAADKRGEHNGVQSLNG